MKKLTLLVVIVILTAFGTAWAQDKGIETKTLRFPYGTTFRVENNVAQYQILGDQTWQNMELPTGYSPIIVPLNCTIKGSSPKETEIGIAINHDIKILFVFVPDINEGQTLKKKLIDKLVTIYCGETIYWGIPIIDHLVY